MAIASVESRTINQLPQIVENLPVAERKIFDQILQVSASQVDIVLAAWQLPVALQHQQMVKVLNRWQGQVAKFNSARRQRLREATDDSWIRASIAKKASQDDFCTGRFRVDGLLPPIKGTHCEVSLSIASADAFHGVMPFEKHDPFIVPAQEEFLDRLEVAARFFVTANLIDDRAMYSSFMQNNLSQAGASIGYHGHAQVQQGKGFHEGAMEQLFDIQQRYREITGRNYLPDLIKAHQAVGLGVEKQGLHILPVLTPIKERQLLILADCFGQEQQEVLWKVFIHYTGPDGLGVSAFNFSIAYRPAGDGREWSSMPAAVISLVDRGSVGSLNSDIGGSELLLGSSVVAADPYTLQDSLRQAISVN